jgi:hypothetical protein
LLKPFSLWQWMMPFVKRQRHISSAKIYLARN